MNPILNIAIRAIRTGGKVLAQDYDLKDITHNSEKKNILNYIKAIRKKIFLTIDTIIHRSYPHHAVINIFSKKKNTLSHRQWFINPLSGAVNFIKKIPHFCLSLLIKEKNQAYISVIYDPIKNDLFTAIRGQGAQLNGVRTRCCENNSFSHNKIIAIYFKNKNKKNTYLYVSLLQYFLQEKVSFRQTGCSLLDLAYLSSGKINIYLGFNERELHIIFGELQIRESGGLITDFLGGHNYIKSKLILIGHPGILKFFLKKTRKIHDIYENHGCVNKN
ncbi:inositol monophosphatase family protein [Buchnera aphidicola]|uniref:inositol monophosphatase family protein n=1 Tax=Buchnera aphidicola TaxID=9 RepID=UPI00094C256A|nr:inositol monophosphatase family protein [Buchnera aphidicola]